MNSFAQTAACNFLRGKQTKINKANKKTGNNQQGNVASFFVKYLATIATFKKINKF